MRISNLCLALLLLISITSCGSSPRPKPKPKPAPTPQANWRVSTAEPKPTAETDPFILSLRGGGITFLHTTNGHTSRTPCREITLIPLIQRLAPRGATIVLRESSQAPALAQRLSSKLEQAGYSIVPAAANN